MNKIPEQTEHNARRKNTAIYRIAPLLVFIVAGFLIYSNTLRVPFVFDDRSNIVENPYIRLTALNFSNIISAGFKSISSRRPVANISFALNYYFHQYNVVGYHCVNIAIHILTCIFLYFFIKTTLSLPSLRSGCSRAKQIAFFAALLWLVHPVQTQSVTYIVQRMNSMAGMFYILSLLCYVKARLALKAHAKSWTWFTAGLLSGLLAIGSKEIAATLPLFILLYEWYFFQDLNKKWLKRSFGYIALTCIVFVLIAWLFAGSTPVQSSLKGFALRDFTLIERLMTQFRVVIYYLGLLLYPLPGRLNLDYDFPISRSLINPITTLLSLTAVVGLIGLAFRIAKKERLLSFCILWYFGNLVIESSVLPLELIFEHRLYIPSMFVALAIVLLLGRLIKPHGLKIAVVCIIAALCCGWTYKRNNVWADHVTLWRDCVAKSPDKARPNNNLGAALSDRGHLEEALIYLKRALEIDPNCFETYRNIAKLLLQQGKIDDAFKYGYKGLRLKQHPILMNNLSWTLATYKEAEYRNPKEAIRLAQMACTLTGNKHPLLLDTLAAAYAADGQFTQALETAQKALKLAQAAKQKKMIDEIQNRLDLYKKGKPYIEPSI